MQTVKMTLVNSDVQLERPRRWWRLAVWRGLVALLRLVGRRRAARKGATMEVVLRDGGVVVNGRQLAGPDKYFWRWN